ncbi:hypothetical protein B6S44_01245 [Bosea sp. Tri-44]|uniref:NAD-dependent succinate-semialdehyde dehydrogenase n=1 Tax=Bosea sp. Tri-44 TaxID=1972137 RepID=UPI00100FCDE7|nr:NAD-dependent succinate-semialdehyde dehydrogenase [Bosea sp. Tri-44]RXT57099.1 hypothetical protein B6S44_01245 [Bosea sp. Tri-44]
MTYPRPSLWIAGAACRGTGPTIAVLDPATGGALAEFAGASADEIARAEAAAAHGYRIWRATPAPERERVLRLTAQAMRADRSPMAALIVQENGKPMREALAEIDAAADTFDFYAAEARRSYGRTIPARSPGTRMATSREPVGVVAAFSPWNFPAINLVRKLAPALAAGCAVIAKPAEETPATALAIANHLGQAGLPPGALNLLFGDPAQISSVLIASPVIRKVTFTGSTAVGRQLAQQAGAALKRCTMELGGHAPTIICADADPEAAADLVAAAKFRNAGQSCNVASRFYVHRSGYDRFLARLAERARAIVVGPGSDDATGMGPLSNARRLDAMSVLVSDAAGANARVVAGGRPLERPGFYFSPTVLAEVPASAAVMRIEPFGPIAPVAAFDDLDEALALANDSAFALAGYVVTDHAPTARRLAQGLNAGAIGVNTFTVALPEVPFGGSGASGWGHEGGPEGLEPYLLTRFVHEA